MKKMLLVFSVVALLAAGCSSSQQAAVQTPAAQNIPSATGAPEMTTPTASPTAMPTTMAPSPTAMTNPTPTPKPTTTANIVLKVASGGSLGQYLTAANGMTLYTSSGDSANMSNCTGSCAANWPPYTVSSASGISLALGLSGKLGTITRSDGGIQITYNSMPLYFWIQDQKAGDATGNGINGFAVVKP